MICPYCKGDTMVWNNGNFVCASKQCNPPTTTSNTTMTTTPQSPTPRTDAHDKLELLTTKQLAERYEQERKEYQEQLLSVQRELKEARKGKERYEYVRKLHSRDFRKINLKNIETGKPFDDIVDDAINQAKGKQ